MSFFDDDDDDASVSGRKRKFAKDEDDVSLTGLSCAQQQKTKAQSTVQQKPLEEEQQQKQKQQVQSIALQSNSNSRQLQQKLQQPTSSLLRQSLSNTNATKKLATGGHATKTGTATFYVTATSTTTANVPPAPVSATSASSSSRAQMPFSQKRDALVSSQPSEQQHALMEAEHGSEDDAAHEGTDGTALGDTEVTLGDTEDTLGDTEETLGDTEDGSAREGFEDEEEEDVAGSQDKQNVGGQGQEFLDDDDDMVDEDRAESAESMEPVEEAPTDAQPLRSMPTVPAMAKPNASKHGQQSLQQLQRSFPSNLLPHRQLLQQQQQPRQQLYQQQQQQQPRQSLYQQQKQSIPAAAAAAPTQRVQATVQIPSSSLRFSLGDTAARSSSSSSASSSSGAPRAPLPVPTQHQQPAVSESGSGGVRAKPAAPRQDRSFSGESPDLQAIDKTGQQLASVAKKVHDLQAEQAEMQESIDKKTSQLVLLASQFFQSDATHLLALRQLDLQTRLSKMLLAAGKNPVDIFGGQ